MGYSPWGHKRVEPDLATNTSQISPCNSYFKFLQPLKNVKTLSAHRSPRNPLACGWSKEKEDSRGEGKAGRCCGLFLAATPSVPDHRSTFHGHGAIKSPPPPGSRVDAWGGVRTGGIRRSHAETPKWQKGAYPGNDSGDKHGRLGWTGRQEGKDMDHHDSQKGTHRWCEWGDWLRDHMTNKEPPEGGRSTPLPVISSPTGHRPLDTWGSPSSWGWAQAERENAVAEDMSLKSTFCFWLILQLTVGKPSGFGLSRLWTWVIPGAGKGQGHKGWTGDSRQGASGPLGCEVLSCQSPQLPETSNKWDSQSQSMESSWPFWDAKY